MIEKTRKDVTYKQPPLLLENDGKGISATAEILEGSHFAELMQHEDWW